MKEIKNRSEFEGLLQEGKPILMDFYADWCGPCQSLMPIVEQLAVEYEDSYNVVKVNIEQNVNLASEFNVRSIPSLFFINKGIVQENLLGLQSRSDIENKMNQYMS
jgi:thioredoxin 1